MIPLKLAYSPCPNDTFLFYALTHQKIDTAPFHITVEHHDIETLNRLAMEQAFDVVKVSAAHYFQLQEHYELLPVGAALGKGYGPLVLRGKEASEDPAQWQSIGLPGLQTTAALVTQKWLPQMPPPVYLPFHQILDQLASGQLDAGVVIHESRFNYEERGVLLHIDLGQWWYQTLQLPLPLGVLCARKQLTPPLRETLIALLRGSLSYAKSHPEACVDYIQQHSQEKDRNIVQQHIALYVNEYTMDLGSVGQQALACLEVVEGD